MHKQDERSKVFAVYERHKRQDEYRRNHFVIQQRPLQLHAPQEPKNAQQVAKCVEKPARGNQEEEPEPALAK